jgi:hypothetical protein
MKNASFRKLVLGILILSLAVTMASGGAGDRQVALRSGVIQPGIGESETATGGIERWVVRFINETGWFERGRLETAGARIEAPLPGNAFLVSVPVGRGAAFESIPGVDWATPYLPHHKLSPEIDAVKDSDDGQVIVLLQLFVDADPVAVASSLSATCRRPTTAPGRRSISPSARSSPSIFWMPARILRTSSTGIPRTTEPTWPVSWRGTISPPRYCTTPPTAWRRLQNW